LVKFFNFQAYFIILYLLNSSLKNDNSVRGINKIIWLCTSINFATIIRNTKPSIKKFRS